MVLEGVDWVYWKNLDSLRRNWEDKSGYSCSNLGHTCVCTQSATNATMCKLVFMTISNISMCIRRWIYHNPQTHKHLPITARESLCGIFHDRFLSLFLSVYPPKNSLNIFLILSFSYSRLWQGVMLQYYISFWSVRRHYCFGNHWNILVPCWDCHHFEIVVMETTSLRFCKCAYFGYKLSKTIFQVVQT